MPQPEMAIPQHAVIQPELPMLQHFNRLISQYYSLQGPYHRPEVLIPQPEVARNLQPDKPILHPEVSILWPEVLIPQSEVAPILQPDKPILQIEVPKPWPEV